MEAQVQSEIVIAFRREITPPQAIPLMPYGAKLRGLITEFEPLPNRIFAHAANGEQSADRADFECERAFAFGNGMNAGRRGGGCRRRFRRRGWRWRWRRG